MVPDLASLQLRDKIVGVVAESDVSALRFLQIILTLRQLPHLEIRGPQVLVLIPGL
jgi:hypothetical protein